MFEKQAELLSPQDNFSKYRKRIKKAGFPLVPFLGVHLGDLIYLTEAKKKEISKGEIDSARGRESQVSNLVIPEC
jgi:hypothetical protein